MADFPQNLIPQALNLRHFCRLVPTTAQTTSFAVRELALTTPEILNNAIEYFNPSNTCLPPTISSVGPLRRSNPGNTHAYALVPEPLAKERATTRHCSTCGYEYHVEALNNTPLNCSAHATARLRNACILWTYLGPINKERSLRSSITKIRTISCIRFNH